FQNRAQVRRIVVATQHDVARFPLTFSPSDRHQRITREATGCVAVQLWTIGDVARILEDRGSHQPAPVCSAGLLVFVGRSEFASFFAHVATSSGNWSRGISQPDRRRKEHAWRRNRLWTSEAPCLQAGAHLVSQPPTPGGLSLGR